jgi:predicted NAD/FAD-binding protein
MQAPKHVAAGKNFPSHEIRAPARLVVDHQGHTMGRVAIIGSGISGLACAEMLRDRHDITVFEAADRPGGHARTVFVDGTPVDTGFIVYNEVNYPLLTGFLKHLGVETQPSNMSFGVRLARDNVEFSASGLRGLFAQPKNFISPTHWSMLRDVLRFFRHAPDVLKSPSHPTLLEMLDDLKLGSPFRNRFLIPMGAAIWSTPPQEMLSFPAKTFVRFFQNHGLLSIAGQHPWRTITGGSRKYVEKMVARLGGALRLSTPVTGISGRAGDVRVSTAAGTSERYDAAVLCCHADQSLRLVSDATEEERKILGAFAFRDNEAVLHRDERQMPKARAAWASWIYSTGADPDARHLSVTYWMNQLQSLPGPELFVTLNPDKYIEPGKIVERHVFRHPVFSAAAIDAQERLDAIQGVHGKWFCGAWCRYGFHEDGIWSAERVSRRLGGHVQWA